MATTIIDMPQWSEKSSISFLATKTQKTATGAIMRNIVRNSDLTSGPKMNRPQRKNFCKVRWKTRSGKLCTIQDLLHKHTRIEDKRFFFLFLYCKGNLVSNGTSSMLSNHRIWLWVMTRFLASKKN